MANKLELKQHQAQLLRTIPAQLKLGKILEINNDELLDVISAEIDENPALGLKYDDLSPYDNGDEKLSDNSNIGYITNKNNRFTITYDENILDWENLYRNFPGIEAETLYEHIINQINDLNIDTDIRTVLNYMTQCLDNNGYITRSKAGISDDLLTLKGIEINNEILDAAWDTLRSLEPPGIGATDLQDCLLLQLERKPQTKNVKNAHKIISEFFNSFIRHDFDKIKKGTYFNEQELKDAINLISTLNPKPGAQFSTLTNDYESITIRPDFSVLPDVENPGQLVISSSYEIPELTVRESFSIVDKDQETEKKHSKTKKNEAYFFIRNKCVEAQNFIELINLRQKTLLRIIKAITKIQKKFFITGDILDLVPMGLKDVAAITGDDLSVLSRATSNRYIFTTSGIIPLKSLFNDKKSNGTNEGVTEHIIIDTLKNIITNEDYNHPYTDDELKSILEKKGFRIARRTVAKYRDKAGIPVARNRKKSNQIIK